VLIPYFGAQNTLALGIGINITIGVVVLSLAKPSLRLLFVGTVPLVLALLLLFPSWNRKAMVSGVAAYPLKYVRKNGTPNQDALYENPEILFFKEGISTTVAVTKELDGNIVYRVNGKPSASFIDIETNFMLAYIPLLHHPAPHRIAVIGMGSGVTAGVATLFNDIEAIDILELEPAVLDVPPHFRTYNFAVLEDPRVSVHFDDGRSGLAGLQHQYDVIVSEPSNPWIAGESNLFTREFMSMVKSKLTTGGVFAQWVQGYSLTSDAFKLVVRTFRDVFPQATLWETSSKDYLLVGTGKGWEPTNLDGLRARIQENPRLSDAFRGTFNDDPLLSFFRTFRIDVEPLKSFAGDGALNRDDRNVLEFEAPKSLYSQEYKQISAEIRAVKSNTFPSAVSDPLLDRPEGHFLFGKYLMGRNLFKEASWAFDRIPSLAPRSPRGEDMLSFDEKGIIKLDFEQGRVIPLLPQVGRSRPEQGPEQEKWSAYVDYFTRLSGLVEGAGVNGGTALMLDGLEGVTHASYFIPLAVKPAALYRTAFFLTSAMGTKGEAGVGVIEYDSLIPHEGQPSESFIKKHQVKAKDQVRIRGYREGWNTYSFVFRTSPSSRMAHLIFYREGAMDAGKVLFDNILVEEISEE
jgi:hypothetical protein